MELIMFGKKEDAKEQSQVVVISAPEENDEKVEVVAPVEYVSKIEAVITPLTASKMTYTVISIRGDNIKVSKEQAIMGLQDGTYKRIAVTNGKSDKSATVDRFNCEPYAPYQVFDTKVHNVGGCQSATEAIELAELSAAIDEG